MYWVNSRIYTLKREFIIDWRSKDSLKFDIFHFKLVGLNKVGMRISIENLDENHCLPVIGIVNFPETKRTSDFTFIFSKNKPRLHWNIHYVEFSKLDTLKGTVELRMLQVVNLQQ